MRRKAKQRKAKNVGYGWQIKNSLDDWVTVIGRSDSKDMYSKVAHVCLRDEHGQPHRFRPKQKIMSRRPY